MPEIYYVPLNTAEKLSAEQLALRFSEAGLPCKIEREADGMDYLAFEGRESNILISTDNGVVTFCTFNAYGDDPGWLGGSVDEVMMSSGFSADEDADADID